MKSFFIYLTLLLTFIVVTVGAYVRLSDAGLGCPDWPGCYGKIIGVAEKEAANERYPDSPYDLKKAWIEVGHRYIAGILGIFIAIIAYKDFIHRRRWGVAQTTLLLVIGQAVLGMLTVTEKLNPTIVTSHLLGGMAILALLSVQAARSIFFAHPLHTPHSPRPPTAFLRVLCGLCGCALLGQIFLGGWVSTNYAALACPAFPHCQAGWVPPHVDFAGYELGVPLHSVDSQTKMTAAMLATIHWTHRLGALVVTILFVALAMVLIKARYYIESFVLLAALGAQITLGILTVIWQLPLGTAVLHNAFAALLVVIITHLWVRIKVFSENLILSERINGYS